MSTASLYPKSAGTGERAAAGAVSPGMPDAAVLSRRYMLQ
jgi:hypothetical protein